MLVLGPPQRQSVEEGQQRGRPIVDSRRLAARFSAHRQRAGDAPRGQMLEQSQEERKIAFMHALFIKREDVRAALGLQKVIGILHAFGDALEGQGAPMS